MTVCLNASCPFDDCDHHSSKIDTLREYSNHVNCAYLDGTCRRYIGFMLDSIVEDGEKSE